VWLLSWSHRGRCLLLKASWGRQDSAWFRAGSRPGNRGACHQPELRPRPAPTAARREGRISHLGHLGPLPPGAGRFRDELFAPGRGRSAVAWCPAWSVKMARAPEPAARAGLDGGNCSMEAKPPCPDHAGDSLVSPACCLQRICLQKGFYSCRAGLGGLGSRGPRGRPGPRRQLPAAHGLPHPIGIGVVFRQQVAGLDAKAEAMQQARQEGVAGAVCRPTSSLKAAIEPAWPPATRPGRWRPSGDDHRRRSG